MKFKCIILLIFTASCFSSCIGKIKEAKENMEDAGSGLKNMNKAVKEMKKAGADMKELQDKEPLTNENFKTWMPESVGGMERTGYKTGVAGYANIASAEATYKNEDKSKSLTVSVIDGAGPTAAFAVAAFRMAAAIDMEEQDEYGYKKTVKREGFKAMETYRNSGEKTEIMFLYDNRFGVNINASGMDADDVWGLVDNLDLKKLSKMSS